MRTKDAAVIATLIGLLFATVPATSQVTMPVAYTPSFWNMDVKIMTEALASEMGKVFVVDASAKARIYWRTEAPIPRSDFYAEFVRVLKAHKLAVVEEGGVVTISAATTDK